MPPSHGARARRWAAATALLALGAAGAWAWASRGAGPRIATSRTPLASRATGDVGDLCADVGDRRVCWGAGLAGAGCADGACLVERPVPEEIPAPRGWRCDGQRGDRTCEGRGQNAGPFDCARGGSCVQREVRLPDDHEWECVETDGVGYCRSTARAAGVAPGRRDPGWICGRRRGHGAERVCVDPSPDRPEGDGWRCGYQFAPELVRTCRPEATPVVGSGCAPGRDACPRDAVCAGGVCVPSRPAAECWLDADCGADSRCRWGTCMKGSP